MKQSSFVYTTASTNREVRGGSDWVWWEEEGDVGVSSIFVCFEISDSIGIESLIS